MRFWTLWVCLIPAAAAAQVSVVSGHPRLYVRQADVAGLKARVGSSARVGAFYTQLKARMDGASSRSANDEVAGFELESLALCHLLEAPSTVYRDKALAGWVRTSYSAGSIGHWDLPFAVMSHALALDWMWASLTPTQRTSVGSTLVAMMDDLLAYAPYDLGPNPSYANQMSDYSNQLYYHLGALAFAGGALADEGINDSRAAYYLSEAQQLLHQHMIPAMNQEAGGDAELARTFGFSGNGGWGEDLGHLSMTHPFLGRMLEAWRTSTGEDLFPRTNGIASLAKYLVYLRRPGGSLSPKGNGAYGGRLNDKHDGTLGALLSARYGDGFGRHVKDLSWTGTTYGFHQLGAVLWYDEQVAAPDFARLPTAVHFQGQGEVVARSGFGAQDTWVYFRSGPIYNGHQHDDQGNLLIEAYGGELFVEDAANGRKATSFHNTLRVGGDQIPYGNNQLQYARPLAGTPQERGRILEVRSAEEFHYLAADFGTAYPDGAVAAPKAGKVTRELIVALPDLIVMRDRVLSSAAVELLLHTWDRPATTTTVDEPSGTISVVDGAGFGWVKRLAPSAGTYSSSSQNGVRQLTLSVGSGPRTLLHVFALSPSSTRFVPSDLELIDEQDAEGARLTDRNGDRWSFRFTRDAVGLHSVRKNDTPIEPLDGGAPDAGGAGGGGGSDGGDGEGRDGGIEEPAATGGCGCDSSSAGTLALAILALLAIARAAPRRRGSGSSPTAP